MRIHGLTVCVDYADELRLSLPRWAAALDSVTVVTSPADQATARLCESQHRRVWCYKTPVFYENGAHFNKGAAIQEAVLAHGFPWRDWLLLFDADIIPPADLRERIDAAAPQAGILHGCPRHQAPDAAVWDTDPQRWPAMNDREIPGYFMLFHTADPAIDRASLVNTTYIHAGNYDSELQNRWGIGASMERKAWLPIPLLHIGRPGVNWCGVGNEQAVLELRRQRREGRHWTQETIRK